MLTALSHNTITAISNLANEVRKAAPEVDRDETVKIGMNVEKLMEWNATVGPKLQALTNYIAGLSAQERIELLALMWQGRDDAFNGRIAFSERLKHASDDVDDGTAGYIAEKYLLLPRYLENGLRLLDAEQRSGLHSAEKIVF